MSDLSHHVRGEQRRAKIVLFSLAVLIVAVGAPLMVLGDMRYDLALRSGVIPGEEIPIVAAPEGNPILIVAPREVTDPSGKPVIARVALYIATPEQGGYALENLNGGPSVTLAMRRFTFIASNDDASLLLFVDQSINNGPAATVEVATGAVTDLPSGQRTPAAPGNWDVSIWDRAPLRCEGISPSRQYVACLRTPQGHERLVGNWLLKVMEYGNIDRTADIMVGRGARPTGGWTLDDRYLFFQNEYGIFRYEMDASVLS